jgi:hypothetical protein
MNPPCAPRYSGQIAPEMFCREAMLYRRCQALPHEVDLCNVRFGPALGDVRCKMSETEKSPLTHCELVRTNY